MSDERDTDAIEVSGFDDTAARFVVLPFEDTDMLVLEQGGDDTIDPAELDDTDRVVLPRARTQPDWPPVPPRPSSRSRRHKAVYAVVARPQTSSDGSS